MKPKIKILFPIVISVIILITILIIGLVINKTIKKITQPSSQIVSPVATVNEAPLANTPPLPKTKIINYQIPPAVMFIDENTELISFETKQATRAVIKYGPTPAFGHQITDDNFTTHHEIIIPNLTPNKEYYYGVKFYNRVGDYNDRFHAYFTTADNSKTNFSLAVLGDSRPNKGANLPEVFSKLINQIITQQPDFAIILGDDVQLSDVGRVETYEANNRWENFIEETKVLRANTPFFSTVGNHDEPDQPAALKKFQEIWPHPTNGYQSDETSYWFKYGNSLFVVLNSEEPGSVAKISEAQISWLENVLKKPGFSHKFIFLHRPLLGSNRSVVNRQQLHQLFRANKVTAAFSGHNHLFCQYQKDGILYLTTGGAGSSLYKNLCSGYEISAYHYVLINVNGRKISGRVIDEGGNVIYEF